MQMTPRDKQITSVVVLAFLAGCFFGLFVATIRPQRKIIIEAFPKEDIVFLQAQFNRVYNEITRLFSRLNIPDKGTASWYGPDFHKKITASGEIYDQEEMTAAHKYFPFGTILAVKNVDTGVVAIIKINDRGPFIDGRIIDVSKAAARQLGILKSGFCIVEIKILVMP